MKIVDTLTPEDGSNLERWWKFQGFEAIYKEFRKGAVNDDLKRIKDIREVSKVFHLKGYQFGNWVTHEDRFNYLAALTVCLYDLNRVLQFKGNNIGLDKHLGIAFGARGKRGALAHYEPGTNIINLTRYKEAHRFKDPYDKAKRFVISGGVGSFAHEYGHFLDYFFGSRVETHRAFSLTNGDSTDFKRITYDAKKYPMRHLVESILEKAYWAPNKKEHSVYANRIKGASKGLLQKYFLQRNEIFARLFEQYISHKLKSLKIQNVFLTKTKYNKAQYMTPTEMKAVIPLFDKLLVQMRRHF
ncbi:MULTISPECIES: LPD1 domain-containing protein [unclassified Aureispira]|uniref:LPD1 domain-containing protein n=1 Tax=unclassified Aureispira TaxID=2649989 RepID=UPI00069791F1|nr:MULTISPECIES: LPD1 domain-containing protein [unclassified Aureispira]WMX17095.1 LPD1 domain-containing protein [Aureispira sp. CCB-E]